MQVPYYQDFDKIEKLEDNKHLLVCIGDSWTWGDSLSPLLESTQHMHEDVLFESKHCYNDRKQYCFGNHLSTLLGADWLNYGIPGESNFYILERLKTIVNNKHIQESYEKIYYVVVLTETGRELNNIDPTYFENCSTLDDMLEISETYIIEQLNNLNLPNLYITRNFTQSFSKLKYKSWVEINYENETIDIDINDINVTGFITNHALKNKEQLFKKYLKKWKREVLTQYDKVESLRKFLSNSKYHRQKSSKHPTKESHKLWAEYLYSIIKEDK